MNAKAMTCMVVCLSVSWIVCLLNETEAITATVGLSICISIFGHSIIRWCSRCNEDPNIQNLSCIYFVKIPLVSILLAIGWIPSLSPDALHFGLDPQRYYFDAKIVADTGFEAGAVAELNYMGILYYYAFIFRYIGFNPFIPAYLNVFLSLIATIVLFNLVYNLVPVHPRKWMLGLLLIIPELLWYDCLTSREIVVMTLISVCFYASITLITKRCCMLSGAHQYCILLLGLFAIGLIRTSMLLPIMITVFLLWTFVNEGCLSRVFAALFSIPLVALIFYAPSISAKLGSSEFKYLDAFNVTRETSELSGLDWSNQSIGAMLVPSNLAELVLFLPIRMGVYLIAPLPKIGFEISGLSFGQWYNWQGLMVFVSSLGYFVLIPLIPAGVFHAIRTQNIGAVQRIYLPLTITLGAIAVGVPIIHERYRIMIVPLISAGIWFGLFANPRYIKNCYILAATMFLLMAIFYLWYKFVLP